MGKNRNSGGPFLLRKSELSEEETARLLTAGGILLDPDPAGEWEFLAPNAQTGADKARSWQKTHYGQPFYIVSLEDVEADIGVPEIIPVKVGTPPVLSGSFGLSFRVIFKVMHMQGLRELIRESGGGDLRATGAAAVLRKEMRSAAAGCLKDLFGAEPAYEELVSCFREGKLREPLWDAFFYVFCGKGLLPEYNTFRILSVSHGIVS